MKISLTPELSYLIGLWQARGSEEGVGICGNRRVCEIFLEEALKTGIAKPDKIQLKEDKIYFYHSAYRAFFEEVHKERLERFKYRNEFAAHYLAGVFDGCGGILEDGRGVFFACGNKEDEMLLLRLGFKAKKVGRRIVVIGKEEFLGFVSRYLKYFE